jgi:hypothetical protein
MVSMVNVYPVSETVMKGTQKNAMNVQTQGNYKRLQS